MASWQAHLLVMVLKWRVRRRLGAEADLAKVRATLDTPVPFDRRGITLTDATVGGVVGEWVIPINRPDAPILLYLHGGGYVACSPRSHRRLTTALARAGFRVFVPDYRLAPENPFPAALDDAVAVYTALVSSSGRLSLAGDSAGGGLAAALLVALRDRGAAMPDSAALFSPWTDLAMTGESVRVNARRDAMFRPDGFGTIAKLYAGEDVRNPLASPLYADWSGMPPLLVHVGADEILRDDSTRLAVRAKQAGTTVELRVWPVVPHVFQLFAAQIPEGRESIRQAAAFLQRHAAA